jgi:monomeric phenylalanine-4-hydroxylase
MMTESVPHEAKVPVNVLTEEISMLPIDHPGAHDPAYRARRDYIARLAREYRERPRPEIPLVEYTPEETAVWRHVAAQLEEAHQKRAHSFYLGAKQRLGISRDEIPQLRDLDERLRGFTGFRLAPIEGLVETRAFLSMLEKRVMLSTQYVRHHSRPDYTPEPDIVHEAIGHIPTFTDGHFADYSQMIGRAARLASEEQLVELGRLYWFTVEFGLIEEHGEVKAFGAGVLSSSQELEHAFSPEVERRPFTLEEAIRTPYDYADLQPVLFVIPSTAHLKEATREFIRRIEGAGV